MGLYAYILGKLAEQVKSHKGFYIRVAAESSTPCSALLTPLGCT